MTGGTTYVLSFVAVGILWASHHDLIFTLSKADRGTIWPNKHVPFWAAAAYAFVVMMCTLSFTLLRSHASRLSDNELHQAIRWDVMCKAWIAIAFYAASMPLAVIDIRAVWFCSRSFRHRSSGRPIANEVGAFSSLEA